MSPQFFIASIIAHFFSTDQPLCPMKIFEIYCSKLSDHPALWQKPRRLKNFLDESTWYEPCPVGHTPLKKFMGVLSDCLQLSHHYTNHCIRATGMTLLNEQGFEARHICAMSSHKNESMIRSYAVQCPNHKKCEMSEALGSALQPAKVEKIQDEENPLPAEPTLDDIDWENDELLLKVLEDIEKKNANLPIPNQENITPNPVVPAPNMSETALTPAPAKSNILTVNNNVANVGTPRIPIMYFLHSNVTINYNFH